VTDRPLVSMLLLAYQQQDTIREALNAALAQTYMPLEIIVSDDASTDHTWAQIERTLEAYAGPHRVIRNRNETNLGIGAHISRMVALSQGELLFVAAGDDVSMPERCERVAAAWLAADRRPDLISSALVDLDAEGGTHAKITPADLSTYRSAADWLASPPYVVGAAQAWTRRLFDRFGPLPAGVVGEDLVMVFRAIVSGGAITLPEPLVQYRRGGISRRRRTLSAQDVIGRMLKSNRSSLVETRQLLADAGVAGQLAAVEPSLTAKLAREEFIRDVFAAGSFGSKLTRVSNAAAVPLSLRLRVFVYAACPGLLAPWFALKRRFARQR
jgi:glycosyltransferase involved in cell wall biosynthesis